MIPKEAEQQYGAKHPKIQNSAAHAARECLNEVKNLVSWTSAVDAEVQAQLGSSGFVGRNHQVSL